MVKKQIKRKQSGSKELEILLSRQTGVILDAVNKKQQETNKHVQKVEGKVDKVYNKLDEYLKKYTEQDQEFKLLKVELKLVKDVLKDKLGVDIDTLLFR